jgi:DNA-binding IclR family transcriptional regulator
MDAIKRVFGCLEALDAAERPLSLNEIQAVVGCPTASLATTLRSLVSLGYLHHDRSRRTYAPTVLLADLGGWVASRFAPGPAIQEAARAIRERTGENVAIAHRNDIRLQYLHFLPGDDLSPAVRVGTTRLLCRSGLGWALLAFLSNRAIQSIVRRTNATLASEDRVDLEPLLAMVERCRQDGHIHAEHTLRAGYAVIAMPIRGAKTGLAIGVSGPAERIRAKHDDVVAAMRQALGALPA